MLGSHAPTHDPQPGLQNVPAIQESNSEIPETHNSQELEPRLRSNHRQLPRHPPRQVSGRRLAAVYQGICLETGAISTASPARDVAVANFADEIASAMARDGVQGIRLALKDVWRNVRSALEQSMRLAGAEDENGKGSVS